MSVIGHNGGPSLAPGHGFRRLAWQKARRALLPNLPREILRIHVARAKRLGLPYRTYATIRATSGRDIVAFLFSANALEVVPSRPVPPSAFRARLAQLDGAADRLAAVYAPLSPASVVRSCAEIDAACRAPDMVTPWWEMRDRLRGLMRERGLPPDGVVLVSATALEREWCSAAGLAGTLAAGTFFAGTG